MKRQTLMTKGERMKAEDSSLRPSCYSRRGMTFSSFIPHTSSLFLALHRGQELGVRFGLLESFEHDFHLLYRRQRVKHPSHHPNTVQICFADQKLFLTCP